MRTEEYVGAGLHTFTAATRYEKWATPGNKELVELKQMYADFTERLANWYGVSADNDISTTVVLCTMLLLEEQLMQDIADIRYSPEWDEDEGTVETLERNTVKWYRTYAYCVALNAVMHRLGQESKRVQADAVAHQQMQWCKGAIRDAMLKHMDITPGELAEMCAERLPKHDLEELEVFSTTLQVAKKFGVDFDE